MVAEGNKEFTLFVTINLQSFERANIQRNICPDLNPFWIFVRSLDTIKYTI
jgi:hypothetical protein